MQNFVFIFIVVFLLVALGTMIVALIYLFQQLRISQSKVEDVVKNYETQFQDIQIKHQQEIEKARRQSVDISRRTIKGQIAEQLAPNLEGFPYLPSDSRFIGDPVDYIIFNGYTDFKDHNASGDDLELVLVEIKQNKAQLSNGQKQISKAIEAGKVRFEIIRISNAGTVNTHSLGSPKKVESSTPIETESTEIPSSDQGTLSNPEKPPLENVNSSYKNWYAFLEKFPNAYEPWSEPDDELLREKYLAGMKVNELALLLKRNPGKIRSRLKEKGLIKKK